jgi:hypothetical protein
MESLKAAEPINGQGRNIVIFSDGTGRRVLRRSENERLQRHGRLMMADLVDTAAKLGIR